MRASLNIPWAKFRQMKRWLSKYKVSLAAEKPMRNVGAKWVGPGLTVEMVELVERKRGAKETTVITRPWAYFYNLIGHIFKRLDKLKEANLFRDHPHIPEEEIHIKIGGDHGGSSFKMSYQVCNVDHPNKPQNTVVFCVFEAKDSSVNLRLCLERFKRQVDRLQKEKWQGKTIRVFMFGDYAFLMTIYGLSGCSGKIKFKFVKKYLSAVYI